MYVGLSGGIGSGKTTVSGMLRNLGAVVIDADAIAREVLEPGQVGYDRVVSHFGIEILDKSKQINRKALAALVFTAKTELKSLEAIIHPAVTSRVSEIRESFPKSTIVVYDTPLLVERNLQSQFEKVLMVVAELDLRKQRLIDRGLSALDIDSRIANQVSDDQRIEVADLVLMNNGSIQDLQEEVNKAWHQLTA